MKTYDLRLPAKHLTLKKVKKLNGNKEYFCSNSPEKNVYSNDISQIENTLGDYVYLNFGDCSNKWPESKVLQSTFTQDEIKDFALKYKLEEDSELTIYSYGREVAVKLKDLLK